MFKCTATDCLLEEDKSLNDYEFYEKNCGQLSSMLMRVLSFSWELLIFCVASKKDLMRAPTFSLAINAVRSLNTCFLAKVVIESPSNAPW